VYEAARRKGLPEYVFGVDHVRWVVWRPPWEGYQGYRWANVTREILAQGGRMTLVAELKETQWENRENIFFRRYSGGTYLYYPLKKFPSAGIFRVDWPDNATLRPLAGASVISSKEAALWFRREGMSSSARRSRDWYPPAAK
jgi:hypothetical protein